MTLDETERGIQWLKQFSLIEREIGRQFLRSLRLVSHTAFESAISKVLEDLFKEFPKALGVFGFVVNRKKTHVLGPGARKVVTGLVVNDTVPRLKRKTKSHIEVVLYHIETKGLIEHARRVRSKHPISYLNHLSGLIQFARWVEPAFGHKAQNRLNAICEKNAIALYALQEFSSGQDFITKHTLHH